MTSTHDTAVNSDVHGGASFLSDVFIHDNDDDVFIYDGAEFVDTTGRAVVLYEPPTPPPTPSRLSTWWRRSRAAVSRAVGAVRAALAVVRGAVGWLTRPLVRSTQRRRYTGRHQIKFIQHRVKRTVLGRERSSFEYAGIVQQRSRGERTEEGDLAFRHGDTFVGWIQLAVEAIRYHEEAIHPDGRHRFICS